MNPIASGAGALDLSAREVGGDPFEPVILGDICPKRVSFRAPIWASLVALGVVWIATARSSVPAIPMCPVFKKATAREAVLAAVTLPSGIAAECYSKSSPLLPPCPTSRNLADENYRIAVATLVNRLA